MKELIACCGIDCEKCDARIATINNDNKLREETAKKWRELNNTSEITTESINCMGCRGNGIKFRYCSDMCEIRKCSHKRGYKTCSECRLIDNCKLIAPIINNVPEARNNILPK